MQVVDEIVCAASEVLRKHRNKTQRAEQRRKYKIRMLSTNATSPAGSRVCTKCLVLKRESEYSCRGSSDVGKRNSICDACLTRVYASASRKSSGFCPIFWRKRAYSCNTSYRVALARRQGVLPCSIGLNDLPYICKPQDLADIFEQQNGCCSYCSVSLSVADTSVDHATPSSRGGAHHPSNLRITCWPCNRLKHTMTEEEFKDFIHLYINRFK